MEDERRDTALVLGLDSSTQGVKALVIRADNLQVVGEWSVNYDLDLPHYATRGGVHHFKDRVGQMDEGEVTAPPLMWAEALQLLLEKMKKADEGTIFGRIKAVSASGQQHGSVYWRKGAEASNLAQLLNEAQTGLPSDLMHALKHGQGAFSVPNSPIWMDSSTTPQCRRLEEAMGGPQRVAEITGSRAYERFTGNQIARVIEKQPQAYADTERISLVSSFVACLFVGRYAPIDRSDGSGMNLMDIRTKDWSAEALKIAAGDTSAEELADKLGNVVPSHSVVGKVAPFFRARYGFPEDCLVIASSGDNPNSVAGMRLGLGDVSISLGTSDTAFGILSDPKPSASEGHIFCNPVDPDGSMAMVCYKNGSLTRQHFRDLHAGGSWDEFNALLQTAPIGNNGKTGFFFKEIEITPPGASGFFRFDADGKTVDSFAPEVDVRAVVEGQFLSMRLHASNIGMRQFSSILVTGGGSSNTNICKVVADVFGVPVFKAETSNSASLGAAYRALHGWLCRQQQVFVPFSEVLSAAAPFTKVHDPDMAAHEVYTAMLPRYEALEKECLEH
ncbi:xylulose kinase [Acanthamoeba castellanii str. Neff]|uniref:Xylulose kinase n=1 Tax=Acanthamoeba castellanii (strain ATCC 30010 / Neff) TaxID=1257118 RepID=L8GMR9_ACACF|nr:xylulose kinase [Acanthamoeba castellanii str. Neff]ELR14048.1 xylulose kinase [Acanthamoeba castellanii str. Neff]